MDQNFRNAMSEERARFKKNIERYRDIDNFARNEVIPDINETDSDATEEDEETLRLLENITDLDPLLESACNDDAEAQQLAKMNPNSATDCTSIFLQIFQTQKVIIANQQKIEKRLQRLEEVYEENAIDKVALLAQNKCLRECKVLVAKVLSGVSRLTDKIDDDEARTLGSKRQKEPTTKTDTVDTQQQHTLEQQQQETQHTLQQRQHPQPPEIINDEYLVELSATLPLASIDAIKDFEEKLQEKEYVNATAVYLNQLKDENGTVDSVFRKVMTDELIFSFNYDGRNTKRALSKLKLINHVLYGIFSEEGRVQFEKAVRKSVDMSHNRMHQKKFQKNKNPPGMTVKPVKKRRRRKSDDE